MRVRVYGNTVGSGSFARVTAGMAEGLRDHGILDGIVPMDNYDEEEIYEGAKAPLAVYAANPNSVAMMRSVGWHEQRLALLPANSTYMPKELIVSMEQHVTGFLAPSMFAVRVLRNYTDLPVYLWRHGVAKEFRPDVDEYQHRVDDYDKGYFEVAHLASTHMERKGTEQLLEAWAQAARERKLGNKPLLRLLVDGNVDQLDKMASRHLKGLTASETVVTWRTRFDMDVSAAAHFYRKFHAIVQPSRGEGFGLVPLEARACGTVVIATSCTGHSEHICGSLPYQWTVAIKTHEPAPIDDGPGALAPRLDAADVYTALVHAYSNWKEIASHTRLTADKLREMWSWWAVTTPFIQSMRDNVFVSPDGQIHGTVR